MNGFDNLSPLLKARWGVVAERATNPQQRPTNLSVAVNPDTYTGLGDFTQELAQTVAAIFFGRAGDRITTEAFRFEINPLEIDGDNSDDPLMAPCVICPNWSDVPHTCLLTAVVQGGFLGMRDTLCASCATLVAMEVEEREIARRTGGDATGKGEGLRGHGGESS